MKYLKAIWQFCSYLFVPQWGRHNDGCYGMKEDFVASLREFMENEMRSCSMDIGGITPEYVQRAWGGRVAIEDIEAAFEELKRSDNLLCIGK